MTSPNVQIRRATVEDLPRLSPLWQDEGLPVSDLEKRFKEFQVAVTEQEEVLGAIGLQIVGLEGHLHSEAFAHPEQADGLRDLLWQRIQTVAANHGLVRVWTYCHTPFWHSNGFRIAVGEALARVPVAFGAPAQAWQFLQVRDEAATSVSLEKEFALFRETEREETQRIFRQARVMKLIAGVVAAAVFLMVIIWAVYFFKLQGRMPR